MTTKSQKFIDSYLKKDLPDIKSGDLVKVYQKIKEGDKERVQVFEGRVIARKHGKGISATITVRRISGLIAVEKIFPIHLPSIEKIEILERGKVRRSKLYYLRDVEKKKTRLKRKEFVQPEIKEGSKKEEKEIKEEKQVVTEDEKSEKKE